MLIKSLVLAVSSLLVFTPLAISECIPSDDPCAPKKTLNSWVSSAQLGFNQNKGNTENLDLILGFRTTFDDNTHVAEIRGDYSYGEDDNIASDRGDTTSKNDFEALVRYDYVFTERWYSGLGLNFSYDEVADIDYRLNTNPKIGYYLLRDNSFRFRVETGPSYVFEKTGGEAKNYFAPRIAERFEWAISCESKFFQDSEFLFDVDNSDNYIINAEIGAESALNSSLAVVFTVRKQYDNEPAESKEKDDLSIITSLKISL